MKGFQAYLRLYLKNQEEVDKFIGQIKKTGMNFYLKVNLKADINLIVFCALKLHTIKTNLMVCFKHRFVFCKHLFTLRTGLGVHHLIYIPT